MQQSSWTIIISCTLSTDMHGIKWHKHTKDVPEFLVQLRLHDNWQENLLELKNRKEKRDKEKRKRFLAPLFKTVLYLSIGFGYLLHILVFLVLCSCYIN